MHFFAFGMYELQKKKFPGKVKLAGCYFADTGKLYVDTCILYFVFAFVGKVSCLSLNEASVSWPSLESCVSILA